MRAPTTSELLTAAHVVVLPLQTRFRGVSEREAVLFEGPHGWGEFAPFLEYDDAEAARWLAAAVEAAWAAPVPVLRESVPVNATVPAVEPAAVAGVLARFPGCGTAKVKVGERGQSLADDVARLAEVRCVLGPTGRIRVDANGSWDVEQARTALAALARFGLEYAEQPCPDLASMRALRTALARDRVDVPLAADELVRKAADPSAVSLAGAADVLVVKAAPLGGVRAALAVAQAVAAQDGAPAVVSSALDTSVGLAAGVRLAAALPDLPYACGLGTAALLARDVCADPLLPVDGRVAVRPIDPDPLALAWCEAPPERVDWWHRRITRCVEMADLPGCIPDGPIGASHSAR